MTDGDSEEEAIQDNSTSAVLSYSDLLLSGADDDINHLGLNFTLPLSDYSMGDSINVYSPQYHKNAVKMKLESDRSTCINHPSSKKRNAEGKVSFGDEGDLMKKSGEGNGTKKNNIEKTKSANLPPSQNQHAKVKKAKVKKASLGERIFALQKLVSPFGKTDTASVLHETKGYIKFLQGQVHLLCSPYLQLIHHEGGEEVKSRKDLRSKGLCVVPTEITSMHVTNDNGADYWSPANALVKPPSS